jgi:hypothetical protein
VKGNLEKSQEMSHYMFCPGQKKTNLPDFQNQKYVGIFISLRERERERESERESKSKRKRKRERERQIDREKSAGNF